MVEVSLGFSLSQPPMLEPARLVYQVLSVALFLVLCWQPRYPLFMAALLVGAAASLPDWNLPREDPASRTKLVIYQWVAAATLCCRMLATLEAFVRRTEDATRRWLLFGAWGGAGALTAAAVFGLARETGIPFHTNVRMAAYVGMAAMLAGLLIAMWERGLRPAYRRDQTHAVLLCLALALLGLSGLIRLRDDLAWADVGDTLYWAQSALLACWLWTFGRHLVPQEFLRQAIRQTFKPLNPH